MKKIVALALSLVMALALCTVAFAADPTFDDGKAYRIGEDKKVTAEAAAVTFVAADKDEKTVAHYEIGEHEYFVADKAVAGSYAIKTASGWVYLEQAESVEYVAVGTEYAKTVKAADAKCGEFGAAKAGVAVYSYTVDDDTHYARAAAEGDAAQNVKYLLIGEKVVGVVDIEKSNDHKWVNTFDTDKITLKSRVCENCKKAEVVISYNEYILLKDADRDSVGNTVYFKVTSAANTTNTTTSPKTFDAGIAMYVGMSLMSVAGSAVVIGKKKEF